MVAKKKKQTILCTWEIGGELGHISRISAIAKALDFEGYQVVVALKDLSRAYPFFCDTGITLLQAPVWLPKITLQRPIACMADALLLLGYLETDPLHAMVSAWQSLVDMVQPDLVIFDYSPTAMLALLHTIHPKILIGNGFSIPIPGQPTLDWRPYETSDDLVVRQEQRVLQQINAVLTRQSKPGLQYLADLFRADRVLVSTFPELDLYGAAREGADYCLGLAPGVTGAPVIFPRADGPRILAYLKPAYSHIKPLIAALARCHASVFIACPQGQPELFRSYVSEKFHFSTGLVDLQKAMNEAHLFVGHGNATSVKESVMSGNPVMVLPIQLEQLLTGKKVQACGAGVLLEKVNDDEEMLASLNAFIAKADDYRSVIARMLVNYPEPRIPLHNAVTAACADLLARNT